MKKKKKCNKEVIFFFVIIIILCLSSIFKPSGFGYLFQKDVVYVMGNMRFEIYLDCCYI
jgi:hypothetical protein